MVKRSPLFLSQKLLEFKRVVWVGLVLLFLLSRHESLIQRAAANTQSCTRLALIPVKPKVPDRTSSTVCNSQISSSDCQIKKGFQKFKELPQITTDSQVETPKRLGLEVSPLSNEVYEAYVEPLKKSPVIQKMDELRIFARTLADHPRPCEPTLVYLNSKPIFNVGPAFVEGHYFDLNGSLYTGFLTLEDAKAPLHIPIKMLSKDSLIESNYYDLVAAHEMAHGLMQDLYGVEKFKAVVKNSLTRDGHMASATTDPEIAWVEGFAEGFETYLGALNRALPHFLETPRLSRFFDNVKTSALFYESYGKLIIPLAVPSAIFQTATNFVKLDDFVSDFLKSERQVGITNNYFIFKGLANNLVYQYGVVASAINEREAVDVMSYEVETDESITSKEGAVGYLVYQFLKNGLEKELFSTIHQHKPGNVAEFVNHFLEDYKETPAAFVMIPVIKEIFTQKGREAQALFVSYNRENPSQTQTALAAKHALLDNIETPLIQPPRDFWLEFKSRQFLKKTLGGVLDRINLVTVSKSRLIEYLKSTPSSFKFYRDDRAMDFLISELPEALSKAHDFHDLISKLEIRLTELKETLGSGSPEFLLLNHHIQYLKQSRSCFINRCVEQELEKPLPINISEGE